MKQNKLVIGIIPQIRLNDEDPYLERYEFVDMYAKKIYEANCLPIGLVLNDKEVSLEQLELCDAFIWPGGSRIDKRLYKILYYALKRKKPVLGICLGMQAMCIFSTMLEEIQKNNLKLENVTKEKLAELYLNMAQNDKAIIKMDNPGIHDNFITLKEYKHALHPIKIDEDSILSKIYGNQKDVLHMHSVKVLRIGSLLKVIAKSDDNVIEAVESCSPDLLWLGVQFHPEFLDEDNLIKDWINLIRN